MIIINWNYFSCYDLGYIADACGTLYHSQIRIRAMIKIIIIKITTTTTTTTSSWNEREEAKKIIITIYINLL